MGESVNLIWPLHTRTFQDGIWNLLQEKCSTDFQLIVNTSTLDGFCNYTDNFPYVNVHRLILAIFCPNVIKNYKGYQLYLDNIDIEQEDLNCLVELIYRGKVSVAESRLEKVKSGAEILGLTTVVDLVDKYFINKTLKEEEEKLELGLKCSRGARKRKGKPFKISKRMSSKRGKNISANMMNEAKFTEKLHQEVLEDIKNDIHVIQDGHSNCQNINVEEGGNSDVNSESEQDGNYSRAESDSSDYNPRMKNLGMMNSNERRKRNLWKKVSPGRGLERLRSRRGFGVTKKKRRVQTESQPPAAFDTVRKQFVCKFCDKGFSTKDRHARHVRCHENPDNLQKCLHCDYKTVEKYVLVQHLASKHHVDRDGNQLSRDIKCSDCAFTCVSNFQLKNHKLQKHSNKQFKCDECGHLFGKKALRDRHVLAKHRNERPYMCETCGHRAKTLNAFKSHLELHSGKKFVCDICGLALTLSCSLKRHMKLHMSNERPFPCHLCSFATRKRYNLRVHLRNVHKLEMDSMGNVTSKHELMVPNNLMPSSLPSSLLSGESHHNHHHHQTLESALCIPELEAIHHIF